MRGEGRGGGGRLIKVQRAGRESSHVGGGNSIGVGGLGGVGGWASPPHCYQIITAGQRSSVDD